MLLLIMCVVSFGSADDQLVQDSSSVVRHGYVCKWPYNWSSICSREAASVSVLPFCRNRCQYLDLPNNSVAIMVGNSFLRQVFEGWLWELLSNTTRNMCNHTLPHILSYFYHPTASIPKWEAPFLNGTLFHRLSFFSDAQICNFESKNYCPTDLAMIQFANNSTLLGSFNHELNAGLYHKDEKQVNVAFRKLILMFGFHLNQIDCIVINPGNNWAIKWAERIFDAEDVKDYLPQQNIHGLANQLNRSKFDGVLVTASMGYTHKDENPIPNGNWTFRLIEMSLLVHPDSQRCSSPTCFDSGGHQCIPGPPVETAQWLRYHLRLNIKAK